MYLYFDTIIFQQQLIKVGYMVEFGWNIANT